MIEHHMKQPYNLEPMPTGEELNKSPRGLYYFGIYVKESEIREFAAKRRQRVLDSPDTTVYDMRCMIRVLSQVMKENYAVRFGEAVVTQELKDAIPDIEETVGNDDALVVVILSTNDYYVGYHPSNLEVNDLSAILKRRPCWWQAAAE